MLSTIEDERAKRRRIFRSFLVSKGTSAAHIWYTLEYTEGSVATHAERVGGLPRVAAIVTGNDPFAKGSDTERRGHYEEYPQINQARVGQQEAQAMTIGFEEVLEYLEQRGWKLKRIWKPYRVFVRGDQELPLLVEVHDGRVDRKTWEIIKRNAE